MTYKKRAKAGYNKDKDLSNRKERTYEKELIEGELKAREEPPHNNPEKFVSSGKRTKKKQYKYPEERKIKQITKRLNHMRSFIESCEGRGGEWVARMVDSYKHQIKKSEAKLQELQEKLQKKKGEDEKAID